MAGFDMHHWERTVLRGAGKDLTHAQMRVLLTMGTYADYKTGGNIHPGRQRLADDVGCSINTVDDSMKVFIDRGYVKLSQQGGNQVRKGFANVYQLTYPAWILDASTRYPITGELEKQEDPQDTQSVTEGTQPLGSRSPTIGVEGTQPLGTHHTIDHTIDHTMNRFTSNSGELPDDDILKAIGDMTWRTMLGLAQRAGEAINHGKNGTWPPATVDDNYDNAMDLLSWQIRDVYGDDAQTFFIEKWSIPAKARDRYEAGKNLRTFFNTCRTEGIDYAPISKAS